MLFAYQARARAVGRFTRTRGSPSIRSNSSEPGRFGHPMKATEPGKRSPPRQMVVSLWRGRGTRIYTSTDSGVTWTPRENIRDWLGVASSADGSKLVAIAFQGQIYTSTDSGRIGLRGTITGNGLQSHPRPTVLDCWRVLMGISIHRPIQDLPGPRGVTMRIGGASRLPRMARSWWQARLGFTPLPIPA